MQETTNGMFMEFSCVGYITGYSCVLEESFQIRFIFLLSVWNMISMKDAPHIREENANRISSTCVVAILEREVLLLRNLKFSKIQGHQRKFFQK